MEAQIGQRRNNVGEDTLSRQQVLFKAQMRYNDAASIAERRVKDKQEEMETSPVIGVPI